MVTVINPGKAIGRMFWYNENKVKDGVAVCIEAANYPVDLEQTDAAMRLNMLVRTANLHPTAKTSSIHISMNFAVGEQFSDNKLKEIAGEYMQRIGFGEQPYLVYRHDDAAHPHIHIVTVNIRPDGTRINTYNIGRNKSEAARKAIEVKYGLVKAEEQNSQLLVPVNAARVIYGEAPTRKAILAVLKNVLPKYKYTSLHELNAVLNQYNIWADRGSEDSRIYKHNGLVYHVLDDSGKPVGVPIKASAMLNNPGLKYLEKRYPLNEIARQSHQLRIKNMVDLLLLRSSGITLEKLIMTLKKEGVHVAVRQNAEGYIYGLTYVDHRTQCVFNGSTLGKAYSAKGLLERLDKGLSKPMDSKQNTILPTIGKVSSSVPSYTKPSVISSDEPDKKGLVEELMQPEFTPQNVPFDWRRKKKRKKRKL